ncbi:MAG: DUF6591 domain-containing protein [Oscillospiraceae bacterium]
MWRPSNICGDPLISEQKPATPQSDSYQSVNPQPFTNMPEKKVKKPFYKKWWFWVIIFIAVAIIISIITSGNNGQKIEWSQLILSDVLPEPDSNKGEINQNSEENLQVELYKTSEDEYNEYITKCKKKGFTIDAEAANTSYTAYNKDGYNLDLAWYDDKLTIELKSPMKFSEIQWPTSTVGSLIPEPKSLTGKFSYEHDDSFFVYIGNTTPEDYNEYVNECSDWGFNIKYDKGNDYYYADDIDGNHIALKYQGNNIMSIEIKSADDNIIEEESSAETTKKATTAKQTTATKKTTTKKATTTTKKASNKVSPEFKATMDSYEEFFDEYVEFMNNYKNSTDVLSMLNDYTEYLSKYSEMMDKLNSIDQSKLSAADAAYYLEVSARITKKLANVVL